MRRRTKFLLLGLLLLMAVAAGIGTVAAALFLYRGDDTTRVEPLPPPPEKTKLAYPVLGSWLDQLVAMVESGAVSAREAAANAPIHDDESVAVSIYLSGHVEEVAEFLRDNGGDPRNLGEDFIEALVPVPLLGRTSERPGVLRVREIVPPMATQAAVVSQGAGEHGSPLWNQRGYTGRGVKVGVIDRGFQGVRGLLGTELPESINARCYTAYANPLPDLRACEAPSHGHAYHGTMVAEAIIDVAPDASLYIANPFTRVDLRRTVDWMIEEGVSVINHSVVWPFGGPGDGSSPYPYDPLRTVDRAVEAGIVWVNGAGNDARSTWFGPFTDPDGNGYMSFDDSTRDENNGFRASAGSRILIQLRWDDTWGGATIDLDFFVVRRDPQSGEDLIVWQSEHPQMGNKGDVPYERVRWLSRGGGEYGIRVVKRSGAAPQWVQLVLVNGRKIDHSTQQRSIDSPGESANPGMLAVGAAPWYDVRSIESYSSRGPTPDGRVKPDIVGATCAEASLAPLRDGRRGFCGTSQAAPHVAGMAALVRQRFPQFSPEEVADYLKSHAEQRGRRQPNNTWGYGFAKLPDPPKNCRHNLERAGPLSTGSFFKEWIQGCDSAVQGRGRAQYFTIVLGGQRDMVFTLESGDADAYLYLREGRETSGPALYENDNHSAGSTDSRISGTPASGIYTIEATTSSPGQTGYFIVTVEALDSALSTQEDPAETESSAPEPPEDAAEEEDTRSRLLPFRGKQSGPGDNRAEPESQPSDSPAGSGSGSVDGDRAALVALYHATGGPTWRSNNNWLSGAPISEWEGVTTDDNGRVTELNLWGNELSGEIPSELGRLSDLDTLVLSVNQLTGEIPPELGNLASLWSLHLYGNQLSGEIPSELGNIPYLSVLGLSANQLDGEIPPELGNLAYLTWLGLGSNELSGEIPPELGNLAKLTELDLSSDNLTGEIPRELGDLTNLKSLRLHRNQLSGEIPTELANLSKLEWLHLDHNQLRGEIPAELGVLSNLEGLLLDDNQLIGELSAELGKLANLRSLGLNRNQLSGEIPGELGLLRNLVLIRLDASFTGCLPAEWQDLELGVNSHLPADLPFCDRP